MTTVFAWIGEKDFKRIIAGETGEVVLSDRADFGSDRPLYAAAPGVMAADDILGQLTARVMAIVQITMETGPEEAAALAAHIHDDIVQARLKIMGAKPLPDAAPLPDFIARAKS